MKKSEQRKEMRYILWCIALIHTYIILEGVKIVPFWFAGEEGKYCQVHVMLCHSCFGVPLLSSHPLLDSRFFFFLFRTPSLIGMYVFTVPVNVVHCFWQFLTWKPWNVNEDPNDRCVYGKLFYRSVSPFIGIVWRFAYCDLCMLRWDMGIIKSQIIFWNIVNRKWKSNFHKSD